MIFARGEKDARGTVIVIDLIQADVWFRLAARSPYHDNSQIRAMIEPQMTTSQIDEAKRRVEAWPRARFRNCGRWRFRCRPRRRTPPRRASVRP